MVKKAFPGQTAYPGEGAGGLSATSRWWPVLAAGVLWLAAGVSAGYWILLAWGRTPVVPVTAAPADTGAPDTALVARALGSEAAAPVADTASSAAASRYSLLGVVAGSSQGAALISVDEQPAKPYRLGAAVEGGLLLQSVGKGSARLGPTLGGPATVELTVPTLPSASPSTGSETDTEVETEVETEATAEPS